jgi:hypothetical protein
MWNLPEQIPDLVEFAGADSGPCGICRTRFPTRRNLGKAPLIQKIRGKTRFPKSWNLKNQIPEGLESQKPDSRRAGISKPDSRGAGISKTRFPMGWNLKNQIPEGLESQNQIPEARRWQGRQPLTDRRPAAAAPA